MVSSKHTIKTYKERYNEMCLAVPAELVAVNGIIGTVKMQGVQRNCGLLLVPEAKVGDWVLVHAGHAVQIVDEEEAMRTREAFLELEALEAAYIEEKIRS